MACKTLADAERSADAAKLFYRDAIANAMAQHGPAHIAEVVGYSDPRSLYKALSDNSFSRLRRLANIICEMELNTSQVVRDHDS